MSRKPPLPGLDEEALAMLASQFPSINLSPPEERPAPRLEPAASPLAAAPKAKPPGRGLAVTAILLAVVAILAAAASLAPPRSRAVLLAAIGQDGAAADRAAVRPPAAPPPAVPEAAVAALKGEIAEISGTLAAGVRETRVQLLADEAARRGAEARVAALEGQLKKLDGALQGLQTRLAGAEQQISTTLLARLNAVETKVGGLRQADRRREKFLLAASELHDALRGSGPFAPQLAAVAALAGKAPVVHAALDELQKHARDGVATVAELRDNFTGTVAPRLTALSEANRPGVTARAAAWLRSWYETGPTGDPSADRNAAIVASAERSLDHGELAAAVDQVLLLEDQAALVTAGWLANASARLAVDKAASTLMRQALDRIARAD
ncbi:MAG TPA: mitofilin family membrane protein [Stellaceae bacterium]|nr:mitofilin family membrane protein [Stellaceae bacterium]